MRANIRDLRFWALVAAFALVAMALVAPRVTLDRDAYDVVAFVDITGSMNTRDMTAQGKPQTRLDAGKAAISRLLGDLPCQSRLGLGIFTERRTFLFFNPVEVCGNFAAIDDAIWGLDWRMGWEGDSYVAKGIYDGIATASDLGANLLFVTDGHEAPPLPPGAGLPPFEGEQGKVKGLIVGVGGHDKVPIPKFDNEGRAMGAYGPQDVPQENHSGPPPPDAEKRPGYHPKWAPFGTAVSEGDEHLTSVRTEHLVSVGQLTGLAYTGLLETPRIYDTLAAAAKARRVQASVDLRPIPAAIALSLIVSIYGVPLLAGLAATFRNP
jgi:mxaL protein